MKPVVTFVAGVVLASVVVFFALRRDDPQPSETAAIEQPLAPAVGQDSNMPPVEAVEENRPSTPAPARQNAVAPAPEPRRSDRIQRKPSTQTPRAKTSEPAAAVAQNTQPHAPVDTPPSQPSAPPQPSSVVEERMPPPPPPEPKRVTIPAGTLVSVRVDQRLSPDSNQSGDSFQATLDQPLVVDGFVIAERGARVEGRVVEADSGGRVRGLSRMTLELVHLNTSDGQRLRLQTDTFAKEAESGTKRDAAKVGAAAGIGAAIGAIAGGGKGAAIGAAAGGAAGTGGVLATRGKQAEVPAETRVSFRLRESITVTEKL